MNHGVYLPDNWIYKLCLDLFFSWQSMHHQNLYFEELFRQRSVIWKCNTYSDSQKYESSCLLSDRFWCISPEPFELHRIFYLDQFLKSFQIKKNFFKSEHKFPWFCGKHWFFKEKVSYWKKYAILKKQKNSSWIQPLGVIFIFFLNSLQKNAHATSSN